MHYSVFFMSLLFIVQMNAMEVEVLCKSEDATEEFEIMTISALQKGPQEGKGNCYKIRKLNARIQKFKRTLNVGTQ